MAAFLYVSASTVTFLAFNRRIRHLFQRQPSDPAEAPVTHFTLLIPAHNEERLLPQLLTSIQQLHYPATLFQAVVIADNCTDETANLAWQAGFPCIERFTQEPSSKMQALRFAAEQVLSANSVPGTVVCIIDADCVLDPYFLAELDKVYAQPGAAPVVQGFRSVSNALYSDVAMLDAAAEALRQWVLAGPRKLLRMDNFIFGLGCSMRQPIFTQLMAQPIVTLAEDKEWKVFLTQHHIRVDYCPTARLSYEVVAETSDFSKQRDRWLTGYYHLLRTHGLRMLAQGIRQASLTKLDMACDLLQPPRSVMLLAVLLFGVLAYFFPQHTLVGAGVWLGITLLFFVYGALGLRLIGAPTKAYFLLFSSIKLIILVAKSTIYVIFGRGVHTWDATRKTSSTVASKMQ